MPMSKPRRVNFMCVRCGQYKYETPVRLMDKRTKKRILMCSFCWAEGNWGTKWAKKTHPPQ